MFIDTYNKYVVFSPSVCHLYDRYDICVFLYRKYLKRKQIKTLYLLLMDDRYKGVKKNQTTRELFLFLLFPKKMYFKLTFRFLRL